LPHRPAAVPRLSHLGQRRLPDQKSVHQPPAFWLFPTPAHSTPACITRYGVVVQDIPSLLPLSAAPAPVCRSTSGPWPGLWSHLYAMPTSNSREWHHEESADNSTAFHHGSLYGMWRDDTTAVPFLAWASASCKSLRALASKTTVRQKANAAW